MQLLQLESELNEIVRLVGIDALSAGDRLSMEVARMMREDFLQQNAFSDTDSYTSLEKQMALMDMILYYGKIARNAINNGADLNKVITIPARDKIGRAKDIDQSIYKEEYDKIRQEIDEQIAKVIEEGGER